MGYRELGMVELSLYRFAQARRAFRPAVLTVRVADPPPREAAEADFGLLGLWTDPATAQRRRVWGLLVTLCYSRYAVPIFLGSVSSRLFSMGARLNCGSDR